MPGVDLAILILNLPYLLGAALALTVVVMTAGFVRGGPTRPCHRCGQNVPLALRVCRYCGYDFSPVRFTR